MIKRLLNARSFVKHFHTRGALHTFILSSCVLAKQNKKLFDFHLSKISTFSDSIYAAHLLVSDASAAKQPYQFPFLTISLQTIKIKFRFIAHHREIPKNPTAVRIIFFRSCRSSCWKCNYQNILISCYSEIFASRSGILIPIQRNNKT